MKHTRHRFYFTNFFTMKNIKLIFCLALFSLVIFSCKKDDSQLEKKSILGVNFSQSPIPLNGLDVNFAANIKYGSYNGSTFDIFIPKSDNPTALVIFIHGGSFVAGDKSDIYGGDSPNDIRYCLSNNVAFATINYPFKIEVGGILGCMNEIKRCIQFMRYNNIALNINKVKVGCYGGSAGGGASIWLGFKDEMADGESGDPVLRESTRLQAVGHTNSQASYDPLVMEEIFANVGVDFFSLQDVTETVLLDYGIVSLDELTSNPTTVNMRKDLDMLGWMTSDDPEFYTSNNNENTTPQDKGEAIHHPLQSKALFDKAAIVGITCNANIAALPMVTNTSETLPEYMIRILN